MGKPRKKSVFIGKKQPLQDIVFKYYDNHYMDV